MSFPGGFQLRGRDQAGSFPGGFQPGGFHAVSFPGGSRLRGRDQAGSFPGGFNPGGRHRPGGPLSISSTRLALFVLVSTVAAACSGQGADKPEKHGLNLSVSAGSARVTRAGGVEPASRQYEIATGDEIRLSENGLAALSSGRSLRLGLAAARFEVVGPNRFRLMT
ncbi:MAG: hypothetical protein ACRDIU_10135, partial [Actinomycetota bacterium]